ncbi:unnamed protein product [Adineta ricciae]|uniref:Uncharacterized protein n=1 Tax=Adineta ricciae TaxID=249248 RepID=A0A814A6J4_ADIRI|nr:unnamed protein product [Adineta ricciae]CAF0908686.1 unnamed protein product [Adineta ricciae]
MLKVEGRALNQYSNDLSAFERQRLHADNYRNLKESDHDFDEGEYVHSKRKSDFLLSLYGLPYTLVNKRAFE